MNAFSYGILEDDRLSGNFLKCYVSIRHSGRFMRTANPCFPMSFSIGLIVTECRYWKTGRHWKMTHIQANTARENKYLVRKKVWKKQLWKIWGSKHANLLHHKVGKDSTMEMFLYLSLT